MAGADAFVFKRTFSGLGITAYLGWGLDFIRTMWSTHPAHRSVRQEGELTRVPLTRAFLLF